MPDYPATARTILSAIILAAALAGAVSAARTVLERPVVVETFSVP